MRTNAYCISFTKAIYSSRGEMMGIAGFDALADAISGIRISKNGRMYILESDGRYVTNPDPRKLMNDSYVFADEIGLSRAETRRLRRECTTSRSQSANCRCLPQA